MCLTDDVVLNCVADLLGFSESLSPASRHRNEALFDLASTPKLLFLLKDLALLCDEVDQDEV